MQPCACIADALRQKRLERGLAVLEVERHAPLAARVRLVERTQAVAY
jgi:hypothetical protein